MKTTKEIIRDFRDIKEDYVFDPDIMNMEDERVHRIKEIIRIKDIILSEYQKML